MNLQLWHVSIMDATDIEETTIEYVVAETEKEAVDKALLASMFNMPKADYSGTFPIDNISGADGKLYKVILEAV